MGFFDPFCGAADVGELKSDLSSVKNDVETHTNNNDIHVTASDKSNWNNKLDKNQGTENSGKVLGTNANGEVIPLNGYGFEYDEETKMLKYGTDPTSNLNQGIGLDVTLSKRGYAADAGAVGELKGDLDDIYTTVTNLFIPSEVTVGKYMGKTGVVYTNETYCYTGYIPVTQGQVIKFSRHDGNYDHVYMRFVTAFNSDMGVNVNAGTENVVEYTVPANVWYIIISFEKVVYSDTNVTRLAIYSKSSYDGDFIPSGETLSELNGEKLNPKYSEIVNTVSILKSRLENKLSPQEIKGITQTGYNVMNDVSRVEEEKSAYASVGSTYTYTTNSAYDVVEIPVETGVYTVTSGYIRFAMIADRNNKVLFADNSPSTSTGYNMEVTDDMTNAKLVITIKHGGMSSSKISKNGLKPDNEYTVDDKWVFSKGVENPIIHAYLPKEIYVAVGRTIEIYNKQVCLEAEKYHVQWDCTIGKALKRKFSVTGVADIVGNHTLVCRIYNDSKAEVWTGTTTIKVVEQLSGTYTGVPIGDSLTNAKKWLPEVVGLSNNKISYVGHYSATLQDSNSVSHVIGHEGRSGYTSRNYLNGSPYTYGSGNEPNHNVFWNETTERFDWNNYKLTQNLNPDFVQIYLGTNELSDDNTEAANRIKQMVDLIRQDDSAIPIFVVNTIYFGNQNGIGVQRATDGYSATLKGWWKFNQDCKVMDLMIKLDNALSESTGVYMINLAITHDYEYNFGAVETPVNPRATQTELMPTEGVHPQAQGYYQMADVIYSTYCGVLS